MRIDSREGASGWKAYDAKRCVEVRTCVWCDDETAQWGEVILIPNQHPEIRTRQEDRITIYLDRLLVVFNEVDDIEPHEEQAAEVIAPPMVTA